MGWKDDLREASFKGIPFYVDKTEDEFGRRIVHNEFPGKEIGSIQDLGRKDDVYELTGTGYKKADWLKDGMGINTDNDPLDELKEYDG